MKTLNFVFYIIDHTVCDQLVTPTSETKSKNVIDNILGKMFFKQQPYTSGLGDLTPSII